jgi:hypothetical protein
MNLPKWARLGVKGMLLSNLLVTAKLPFARCALGTVCNSSRQPKLLGTQRFLSQATLAQPSFSTFIRGFRSVEPDGLCFLATVGMYLGWFGLESL